MNLLADSREPVFAAGERRKGSYVVYFDKDGYAACCNFSAVQNSRLCSICHNACIQFVVDDHGEYICSACGKFPRELILQ